MTPSPSVADSLDLPRDRDKVISRLGTGGMAEVFLIRRTGPGGFEKLLALKRIRSDLDAFEYGPMLLREARLVAALQHPNIVQVHDAGSDEGGLWFLMEYVHGKSLATVLERARARGVQFPVECAMYLAASVGRALHYAHNAETASEGRLGVIHRDISPANILISYDGIVKLTDFGIARSNHLYRETQDGVFKGTFAYAAPEHCRGEPLDGASDVFSLGVVLHEAVAARELFHGDSPSQIVHAVMASPIPPLRAERANLPPELDALVQQMLERDRARRVCSGAEVASRLDGIAHEHRLTATSESLAELMRRLFTPVEMRVPAAERDSRPRLSGPARLGTEPAASDAAAPQDERAALRYEDTDVPTVVEPAGKGRGTRPHAALRTSPQDVTRRSAIELPALPGPTKAGVRMPVAIALVAATALLAGLVTWVVVHHAPAPTPLAAPRAATTAAPPRPAPATTTAVPASPAPTLPTPSLAATTPRAGVPGTSAPAAASAATPARREVPPVRRRTGGPAPSRTRRANADDPLLVRDW